MLFVCAGALLLCVSASPALSHAACGNYNLDACQEGEHRVTEPGTFVEYPHGYCAVCIVGQCHPYCEPSEDEDVQLAYRQAHGAAVRGDVDVLLQVAASAGGFVFYNAEREAIQLWDCQQSIIIATFRVPRGIAETYIPALQVQ